MFAGKNRFTFILFVACIAFNGFTFAQKSPSSEADLKRQAENRFNKEDYTGATALYSQLLSLYPKNPEYNYCYGVCLLQSSKDKAAAVSYLESASKDPKQVEEVYYYLGKAYMYTNKYSESLTAFEKFKKRAGGGKIKKMGIDLLIGNCKSAKELMKNHRNVVIINQQQVIRNSFYSSYVFDSSGGKILSTPERFLSSEDKNKITNPVMFLTPDGQSIYYSSYGKKGGKGKDIYRITKQANGDWSQPENLSLAINTDEDEDYPYLHPDGRTLYFSSKGHNSIGGYDVFKSVYDFNTSQWSAPENLGLPINTPDDDIFYVPNRNGDNAQYSTAIESDKDKIGLRKIKIGDVVDQLAVISGQYYSEDQPQRRDAKISVIRIKDNGLVTSVRTDPRTGKYVIDVPPGDDYTLVVEAGGYLAHAENFSLPEGLSLTDLKQKINLDKTSDIEKMTLSNYFTVDKKGSGEALATVSPEATNVVSNEYRIKDGDQSKLEPIDLRGRIVYVTPPKNIIDNKTVSQTHALYEQNSSAENIEKDETVSMKNETSNDLSAENSQTGKSANRKFNTEETNSNETGEKLISENVTNKELATLAYEDAKSQKADAESARKDAQANKQIANEHDSLAKSQIKDIQELVKAGGKDDMEKAKAMLKESEEHSRQAALRYNKTKQLEAEAEQQHNESERLTQEAISMMQSDKGSTAKEKTNNEDAALTSNETNKNKVPQKVSEKGNNGVEPLLSASATTQKNETVKQDKTRLSDLTAASEKSTETEQRKTESVSSTSSSTSSPTSSPTTSSEKNNNKNTNEENQIAVNSVNTTAESSSANVAEKELSAPEKAKKSYSEHQQMMHESKSFAAMADEMEMKVNNMPQSPERDKLISQSNNLNMLSIKKWQQAQQKLNEAKRNDPSIAEQMKKDEIETASVQQTSAKSATVSNAVQQPLVSNPAVTVSVQTPSGPTAQIQTESKKHENNSNNNLNTTVASTPTKTEAPAVNSIAAVTPGTTPDPITSEAKISEAKTIEAKTSDSKTSETKTIDAMTSVAKTSEANTSQIKTPEVKTSEAKTSETKTPETKTSELEVGQTKNTEADLNTSSPEYNDYVATTEEIKARQTETINIFAEGVRLNKLAQQKKEEEISTRQEAATISDVNEKQQQLKKAGALRHQTDSLQTLAQSTFRTAQITTGEVALLSGKASKLREKLTLSKQQKENAALGSAPESGSTNGSSKDQNKQPVTSSASTPVNSNRTTVEASGKSVAALRKMKSEALISDAAKYSEATNAPLSNKHSKGWLQYQGKAGESSDGSANTKSNSKTTDALADNQNSSQAGNQIAEGNKTSKNVPADLMASTAVHNQEHSTIFDSSPITNESIFNITTKPAYSSSNPIPMNPALPEGLVFKVQIGAFHSPLPQQTFKNLQPVTGETTRPGWIRYCVGMFKAFEAANVLKSNMKTIGYKDAFVVAYFNGKRIDLNQAYAMIRKSNSSDKKKYANNLDNETNRLKSLNITAPEFMNHEDGDVNSFYGTASQKSVNGSTAQIPLNGTTSQLSAVHPGLIEYAVQVGVYKTKKVPAALVSFLPLQNEQTKSGLVRFTTGRYSSLASADSSKKMAVRAGVQDAFIVAYKDGYPYALNKINASNKKVSKTKPSVQPVASNQSSTAPLVYKIQLGAFRRKLSPEELQKFATSSKVTVIQETNARGLNIIYAGSFNDIHSASTLKEEIVSKGIKDAFITGFSNGKKVDVSMLVSADRK